MRAALSCLVLVSIAGCDRGAKRVEPRPAHDVLKTEGAKCYGGEPAPKGEAGRAGTFDDRDAQFRRTPCTDAGAR